MSRQQNYSRVARQSRGSRGGISDVESANTFDNGASASSSAAAGGAAAGGSWWPWTIAGFVMLALLGISIAALVIAVDNRNDLRSAGIGDDDDTEPYSCSHERVNDIAYFKNLPYADELGWTEAGRDPTSARYNQHIDKIRKSNLGKFQDPIIYQTDSNVGVSATVTIDAASGHAYFPDWGTVDETLGNISNAQIYSIDLATGVTVWKELVSDYAIDATTAVRTSLSFYTASNGVEGLVFGDLGTPELANSCTVPADGCGAYYYGVRRSDAASLWTTRVNQDYSSLITASPNIVGQFALGGVSSRESVLAADPSFTDFSFVGAIISLNLNDGTLLVNQPTLDTTVVPNITGAAVWGSAPPYDSDTGISVHGTGNLYTNTNADLLACLADPTETPLTCQPATVWSDALIALSGDSVQDSLIPPFTTATEWVQQVQGIDAWNLACLLVPQGPNCPAEFGPDYDFGAGAVIFTDTCGVKYVAALAKSGIMWCFNLRSGSLVWRTYIGTGNTYTNSWGVAFDPTSGRIYTAMGNSAGHSFRTLDGTIRCDGYWVSVNAFTGEIDWLTTVPNSRASAACPAIEADPALVGIIPTEELLYLNRGSAPKYAEQQSDYPNPTPDTMASPVNRDVPTYSKSFSPPAIGADLVWFGANNGYQYALDKDDGSLEDGLRCPEGSAFGGAALAVLPQADGSTDEVITFGCGYVNEPSSALAGGAVMTFRMN